MVINKKRMGQVCITKYRKSSIKSRLCTILGSNTPRHELEAHQKILLVKQEFIHGTLNPQNI